jgi:hypothetical protein
VNSIKIMGCVSVLDAEVGRRLIGPVGLGKNARRGRRFDGGESGVRHSCRACRDLDRLARFDGWFFPFLLLSSDKRLASFHVRQQMGNADPEIVWNC